MALACCGRVGGIRCVAVGLRSLRRVTSVAVPIIAALLLTVVMLTATHASLSANYIVSLQFVFGVGLDYALFFARRQLDQEERARTLRTLVICNAMTLFTFGVAWRCAGRRFCDRSCTTVVIGSLAALTLAFMFAGERPRDLPEPT